MKLVYWNFRDALNRSTPTLFFEDRSIQTRTGELVDLQVSHCWLAYWLVYTQPLFSHHIIL